MTINLTAVTKNLIVQVSDRMFTDMATGITVNDQANKALVFSCENALLTITFAGIGRVNDKRIDHWLTETIQEEGLCELEVQIAVEVLAKKATELFRTFPDHLEKRHVFVIAGWEQKNDTILKPYVRTISNVSTNGSVEKEFKVESLDSSRPQVIIIPPTQPFDRNDRRILQASLRKANTVDEIEKALVKAIRIVASKPNSYGVGKNCMAISLATTKQARAVSYSLNQEKTFFGPFFLWYEGGRNIGVGDIEVISDPGQFLFGSSKTDFKSYKIFTKPSSTQTAWSLVRVLPSRNPIVD